MSKSTLGPKDGAKYNAVKGKMKKGKPGSGDPKAFKSFKKKVADLERKQSDRRRSALDKLFKKNEDLLKLIKKVKADTKMQDAQKKVLVNKIIQEMVKTYQLTPALKTALSKTQFEKEVRKQVGALPDDDQNAANGHLDAILKQATEENKRTEELIRDVARVVNHNKKQLDTGGVPDFALILIALLGVCIKLKDYWNKNK